jgi:protein-S-isoprenylcysteine O-methyltransferase Ste14
MPETRLLKAIYRWRVRAGTIGVLAVLIFARPAWKPMLAGLIVSLGGLAVRAWAAGHLRKEKELAISGPYRYSRNPLYFGNMIIGIGFAVGSWSWIVAAILAAYFLVFYPVVIMEERVRMRALFPEAYGSYERTVPLFFPAPGKNGKTEKTAFSARLYRKNKETRAALGTVIFWVLLVAKKFIL